MKKKLFIIGLFAIVATAFAFTTACNSAPAHPYVAANNDQTIYQFKMKDIDGNEVDLSKYKGKVLVVVNVASKCGNTPQYADLEKFYKENKDKGLMILGFPSNDFMFQEPGNNDEIKSFCTKNYGVTFDMFSKIDVKGRNIADLYQFLTKKELNGVVDAPIGWNFQKFIISRDGHVVRSVAPKTSIYDAEVVKTVQAELAK